LFAALKLLEITFGRRAFSKFLFLKIVIIYSTKLKDMYVGMTFRTMKHFRKHELLVILLMSAQQVTLMIETNDSRR
jgi:hypothetical protein